MRSFLSMLLIFTSLSVFSQIQYAKESDIPKEKMDDLLQNHLKTISPTDFYKEMYQSLKKYIGDKHRPAVVVGCYIFLDENGKVQQVILNTASPVVNVTDEHFDLIQKAYEEVLKTFVFEVTKNSQGKKKQYIYDYHWIGKPARKVFKGDSLLHDIASLNTFMDTLKIKKLYLHDLELTKVPDAIYRFPNVTELYIDQNEIDTLKIDFKKLPRLKLIKAQNNLLTEGSIHLSRNKSLEILNLNQNKLLDIPKVAKKCKRLQSIWFAENMLTGLSKRSYKKIKQVTDLNFYKTGLTVLPRGIKKIKRLEVLDLYHNQLTVLPEEVVKLKRLTHLAVAHNKLKEMPTKLYKLRNLEVLYAHHNWISYLPERIGDMQKIRILDIGYNWFTNFPTQITQLQNLNELDLSSNNFNEFPLELLKMSHVGKIFLRGNPFIDTNTEAKYAGHIKTLTDKNMEVFY